MELDILFWLAIGAIYLFQMFAGRNRQKQVPGQAPVPTGTDSIGGPDDRATGESARRDRRSSGRSPETSSGRSTGPSTSQTASSGQVQPAPTLQDALREISDILSGKPVSQDSGSTRGPSPADATDTERTQAGPPGVSAATSRETRPKRQDPEFRSPLHKEKESAEQRSSRLAELRKKHRTHRTRPLGTPRSDSRARDENVFERRSRPRRSSTYDDLFESPLYEPFGDPIDHQELKVEILEPDTPAEAVLPGGMRLTRDDARQGIIMSEILGPPVSRKRSR